MLVTTNVFFAFPNGPDNHGANLGGSVKVFPIILLDNNIWVGFSDEKDAGFRRYQPSGIPFYRHENRTTDVRSDLNDDFVKAEMIDNVEGLTDGEGTGRGKAVCHSKPAATMTKVSTRKECPKNLLRKPITTDTTKFGYHSQERWDKASLETKCKISHTAMIIELPGAGVPASECQTCVSAIDQEVCILPEPTRAFICGRCKLTGQLCDAKRGVTSDIGKRNMENMSGVKGSTTLNHCTDLIDEEEDESISKPRSKPKIKPEFETEDETEIKTECNEKICPTKPIRSTKLHGVNSKSFQSDTNLHRLTPTDSGDVLYSSPVPSDDTGRRYGRDVSRAGSITGIPRNSVPTDMPCHDSTYTRSSSACMSPAEDVLPTCTRSAYHRSTDYNAARDGYNDKQELA